MKKKKIEIEVADIDKILKKIVKIPRKRKTMYVIPGQEASWVMVPLGDVLRAFHPFWKKYDKKLRKS